MTSSSYWYLKQQVPANPHSFCLLRPQQQNIWLYLGTSNILKGRHSRVLVSKQIKFINKILPKVNENYGSLEDGESLGQPHKGP